MAQEQSRSSDQANVWSEIQEEMALNQAYSETSAAAENHRQVYQRDAKRAAAKELTALGPLPGQCGIAVSHGPWITTVEIFGAPDLLVQHWETPIRSHLLERPEHSGFPSLDKALWVIRRFAAMATQEAPGIGLGTDVRVRDKKRIGQALMHEENLVHGSFWMRQAEAA